MKLKQGTITSILIGLGIGLTIGAVVLAVAYSGGRDAPGGDFEYSLDAQRRVDPNLISHAEVAGIDPGFEELRAVAVADGASGGRVYAGGDRRVKVFSPAGEELASRDLGGEPTCLDADGLGNLYAGLASGEVVILDDKGQQQARWEVPGEDPSITSIAVDRGNVFVADYAGPIILRYDRAGKLLNTLGKRDEERKAPGLVVPSPHMDVAAYPDGLIRVVNPGRHEIEAYTHGGYREFAWGTFSMTDVAGFCGCCNPTDIAVTPTGEFVTAEKGIPRVKLYTPEGRLKSVVAPPEAFDRKVSGLDLAVGGGLQSHRAGPGDLGVTAEPGKGGTLRIYVADPARGRVRIFEPRVDGSSRK